jgi:UDP-glucuronate 4-epimerase
MSPSDDRVLVTGAAGFVGANLCRHLVATGRRVTAWVRPGESPSAWRHAALVDCDVRELDLLGAESVERGLANCAPRAVVHCARGDVSSGATWSEASATSLAGTAHLLDALDRLHRTHGQAPRLVHVGSSLELCASKRPLREDDPIAPDSRLGAIKAAEGHLVRAFLGSGPSVRRGAILRVFSAYGPWEAPHRLIPTAIRCLRSGAPLSLTQPGLQRDWIHVDDVASALARAAEDDAPEGVFHLGSGVEHDSDAVVETLARLAGKPIEIRRDYAPHSTDRAHWCADLSRTQAVLGWSPRHDLVSGLRATLAWWSARELELGG